MKNDVLWTVVLDIGVLLLLLVLLFTGTWNLDLARNQGHEERAVEGSIVLVWGLLGIFVLSVGMSIVFLFNGERAFYIPIVGGILMIAVCILASSMGGYTPESSAMLIPQQYS